MSSQSSGYRVGDYWLICDRTGRKILASESRRQWDGLVVHKDVWEARHPQEFVRGLRDLQTVPISRPKGPLVFIGPLTTTIAAAAAAGDLTIEVAATARMEAGDSLRIMLDNNDVCIRIVQSVTDASHLLLTQGLPFSTSAGMAVIDVTAMSPPTH